MAEKSEESIERALLVRLYEASCKIEYPKEDDLAFRQALMIRLGVGFNLRGLRKKYEFGGPGEATTGPGKR